MFSQWRMVWEARSWMKKSEPFLSTWHVYVGYKFDLFRKLASGQTLEHILQQDQYDECLTKCWRDVGLALGHLKRQGSMIVPTKKMIRSFTLNSPYCIGELVKEIVEMHMPALMSYPSLLQGQQKKEFNNDVYGQTVATTSALIEKRAFPLTLKLLNKHRVSSVLDIGCGTGGYVLQLAICSKAGFYTGIDVNESVISKATKQANQLALENTEFIHTSLEHWDTSRHYDAVMLNNVMHYYSPESRVDLLRHAKQYLKQNGIILLITPLYLEKGGERFSAAFNAFMNAHSNLYSLPTKQEILEDAKQLGLSCDSIKTIVREGSWYLICLKIK